VTAPIVGATRVEHLGDAVAALDIVLTPEETDRLEDAYRSHPVRGHS
jgi:aryl-alcohol dehydrogenase-like predicted oxidoreductase